MSDEKRPYAFAGELTDAQQLQLRVWLVEKIKRGCPICDGKSFESPVLLNGIPYHPNGALIMGGSSVPLVIVACSNCGYTLQFAAVMVGIVPRQPT